MNKEQTLYIFYKVFTTDCQKYWHKNFTKSQIHKN